MDGYNSLAPLFQGLIDGAHVAVAIKQQHLEQRAMAMRQQEMQRRQQVDDFNMRMGLLEKGAKPTQSSAAGPEVQGQIQTPGISGGPVGQTSNDLNQGQAGSYGGLVPGMQVGGGPEAAPIPVNPGRVLTTPGSRQSFYMPTQQEQQQDQAPLVEAETRQKASAARQIAQATHEGENAAAAEDVVNVPGFGATQRSLVPYLGAVGQARQQQIQATATFLSAAAKRGPDVLKGALGQLSPDMAKIFQGVTDPDQILRLGMTPEQQTDATQKGTAAAETSRHNKADEALSGGRNRLEAAKLALEQQKAGFEMGGGVSTTAQMIAAGKLDPQTTRVMLRKSPGLMAQVQKVDPNFDEATIDSRYNTLKEFTSTSVTKAGGQVLALNTLVHHADLYLQTAEALKNGTFRPGNAVYNAVANAFGSAPPTQANLVARFLAGETGKVATGGVPAEGEINGILKNMGNDAGPDQIKGAASSLLQIAAGRMIPLQERVHSNKLDNEVHVLGPDAQDILTRRGFDPATMKPVTPAASPFKVGDSVMYQGKSHRVTAIKPDGKLVLE